MMLIQVCYCILHFYITFHNYVLYQCHLPYVFFFFNSVLRPFQDYFSSYETGQSVGGEKRENPREKPPSTPASRTWLVSHVPSAGLEPAPDTAAFHMCFTRKMLFENLYVLSFALLRIFKSDGYEEIQF